MKMVKFFLQHFWMLQDDARVWPASSLKCCVRLLGLSIQKNSRTRQLQNTPLSIFRNSLDYQHFPDLAGK